jgi:hypothetical protein
VFHIRAPGTAALEARAQWHCGAAYVPPLRRVRVPWLCMAFRRGEFSRAAASD